MKDKSAYTLGVDIGGYSVKCAEMLWEDGQFRLHQAAQIPFDHSSKGALSGALQQLFSKNTFLSKKIRLAVSGPSLIIRRIQMPRLTHSELKGAIRFEAESHIPFPIDDCLLDFQILEQTPADKKVMTVLLVAAKRELVMERLKCVEGLGLDVELVDVGVFCMINAFEKLAETSEERVQGLLNIGHQGSSFAVVHEKLPYYVREMAVGGSEVTKALAQIKGVSETEADKLKLENQPELAPDILLATQKGFELLVDELRHAIDYFENESGESLRAVSLSGGGASSPTVAAVLSEELGRPFSVWDASKKCALSPTMDKKLLEKNPGVFDVALGLALRSVKEKK